jgi:hypothetical protein
MGDFVYSGSGTTQGTAFSLKIWCHSLTLGTAGDNIPVVLLEVNNTQVVNAFKLTVGSNTATPNKITIIDGGVLDSPPEFALGPGPLDLVYTGTASTGPEIPASRAIRDFTFDGIQLTLQGGDLTVNRDLNLLNGVVYAGSGTITHLGDYGIRVNGYIDGTLRKRFVQFGETGYRFHVGKNGMSTTGVSLSQWPTTPVFLSVSVVDEVLPGLLPGRSVSRYWKFEKTGTFNANFDMVYRDEDIRGTESSYKAWFSNGGTPVNFSPGVVSPSANNVRADTNVLTGNWGIGEMLDPGPISISGRVTTSTGNGIPNATVTISGGNLPAPVTGNTGSLGFYTISNLQAGEMYTVKVSAKRYRFPAGGQVVTPLGNMDDVNFTANPQE